MQYRIGKRLISSLIVLFCLLLLASTFIANTVVQAAPAGFVAPCGALFCLNGQVFNVAGTNNHYLGWGTQGEVDQVLNDAKAMNLNVVRGIMHSVRGSLDSTQVNQGTMPLKWNWGSTAESSNMGMKGVYILYWDASTGRMAYNDSTSTGLGRWDYVIWKAKQLNLKLDIALLDFWQWAGGVQQISANFKGGNYDITSATDRYTYFFSNASTKQFYKDWVNHVLNRTNTLTGIKYKDDPTIFAWDLMNEPEMAGTGLGQSWISEMSAYVKSIDSNHMLASGNEGFTDGHAGSNPQLEMNIPTIDFATWHTYPLYHKISTGDVTNLINTHCQTAAGRKPVVIQEFGYPSSNPDQTAVYQSWVNTVYNNPNCAGWMFWRLEGKQENGQYPADNGEHFGIFNNNSAAAQLFKSAASKLTSRNGSQPSPSTPVPTTMPTAQPQPSRLPPTAIPTMIPTAQPQPTIIPPTVVPPTQVQPTAVVAPGETFYKGIDFNGTRVTILGNNWLDYSSALAQGLTVSGGNMQTRWMKTNPATDTATTSMLTSLLVATSDRGNIQISQVLPNGTYRIYMWVMEGYGSNQRNWKLSAEGIQLGSGLGDLAIAQWRRYGPYTVTVTDGALSVNVLGVYGKPAISGMEIYTYR